MSIELDEDVAAVPVEARYPDLEVRLRPLVLGPVRPCRDARRDEARLGLPVNLGRLAVDPAREFVGCLGPRGRRARRGRSWEIGYGRVGRAWRRGPWRGRLLAESRAQRVEHGVRGGGERGRSVGRRDGRPVKSVQAALWVFLARCQHAPASLGRPHQFTSCEQDRHALCHSS